MTAPLDRRIIVVGGSGTGKSWLARAVHRRCGVPYTELDALFHGAGWQPRDEFLDDVRALAAASNWITEWQYDGARQILLERATLLVWLDLPVRTQMMQVIARTIRRRITRAELWNGNREGPLLGLLHDREHIIRWAWDTRHLARTRMAVIRTSHPELPVVHLRSRRAMRTWLRELPLADRDA